MENREIYRYSNVLNVNFLCTIWITLAFCILYYSDTSFFWMYTIMIIPFFLMYHGKTIVLLEVAWSTV